MPNVDAECNQHENHLSTGRVPKWSKGTDCKSVSRGFESHLGLSSENRRPLQRTAVVYFLLWAARSSSTTGADQDLHR